MVWPFDQGIRPYMRMASYWLGQGMDPAAILGWAAGSRHYYDLADMQQAIPEAQRAAYFAERIRSADPTMRLSQLWGLSARAAWYAGYGRAPTAEERQWAYTRPEGSLGLMFEVVGRGTRSGRFQHYTITVNVPWSASLGAIEDYIRDCVASGQCLSGDMGSEPLNPANVVITLAGGALVSRQSPTVTMPGG